MASIASLHVYPIKSARGLSVERAQVGDRGFEGDRRFLVVDRAGRFVTQRQHPRMALLAVTVEEERLRIDAPGMPPLTIARRPTSGEPRKVSVWKSTCDAISLGADAASWMTRFLAAERELVFMPDESERSVEFTAAASPSLVGFADAFPFLIITRASLDELARRGAAVPMDRFRPNLVVDGCAPFAEDTWTTIRVGGVRFQLAQRCGRCTITTIDQETAESSREPLATLAKFRRQDGEIRFGQYAIALDRGVVSRGDEVSVEAA